DRQVREIRDGVETLFPGIYYRSERGAKGEKYVYRDGLTSYGQKNGISTSWLHNPAKLPDILEEIGLVSDGSIDYILEPIDPDPQEEREEREFDTAITQWRNTHRAPPLPRPAPKAKKRTGPILNTLAALGLSIISSDDKRQDSKPEARPDSKPAAA